VTCFHTIVKESYFSKRGHNEMVKKLYLVFIEEDDEERTKLEFLSFKRRWNGC
jgi:hypothetical protein